VDERTRFKTPISNFARPYSDQRPRLTLPNCYARSNHGRCHKIRRSSRLLPTPARDGGARPTAATRTWPAASIGQIPPKSGHYLVQTNVGIQTSISEVSYHASRGVRTGHSDARKPSSRAPPPRQPPNRRTECTNIEDATECGGKLTVDGVDPADDVAEEVSKLRTARGSSPGCTRTTATISDALDEHR
jgi:hypothetical protein